MRRLIIVLLCIVHCALCIATKVNSISDSARFYLVTCEPGDEVYARFGHSGIRVYDSENKIDDVFHWGLFSFDTPNFIGRFISGNTDYEMGVFSTQYFMREYINRGSSVYAQELDLTPEQKHAFWTKLWNNYKPENREYRYNFIYDNCATRPYQLILSAFDYKVSLNYDLQQTTYRDIINKYVPIGSLLNTGINLIIGSQADRFITTKESVTFPLYTMNALNYTRYDSGKESYKPVVKNEIVMYSAPKKDFVVDGFTCYVSIIIPLALAFICGFYTYKKKRYLPYFSQFILLVSALAGCVISYLWFCSLHPLVSNNMNLLWCNPLNIALAILLFIHKKSLRTIKYILSLINVILSVCFVVALILNQQTSTPQIMSIWALTFIVTSTILYTYKSELIKIIKRKHK